MTNDNLEKQNSSTGKTVLYFWAPWCAPCTQFSSCFEAASNQIKTASFIKHNVDDSVSTANSFAVRSVPTVIVLSNGKEIARTSGSKTEEEFIEWLNSALND